jgi:GR25 family glycosyltransferase involved in LPS biosynthesis
MDIFVISLKRSTDRRSEFDKNNSKYISNYTYFDAVDGKTLNINELPDNIFTKGSINFTNGAIGCALSHLKLWEKCIQLNKPIIIMEDDAIVSKNFNKHINNVINNMLPKDWDVVMLSYNFDSVLSYQNTVYEQANCIFNKTRMTKKDIENFVHSKINTTIAKLYFSFGLSSYMISPNGARILKEKCFPLNNKIVNIPFLNNIMCYTIDCMMNTVYKDISAYVCIIPFVITPHISDDYKSTIEN